MVTLYLTSTKAYAGKTLLATTLAKDAHQRGNSVQYFKPVGPYPVKVDGVWTDVDARHIASSIGLDTPPEQLCAVPMTDDFRSQSMAGTLPPLLPKVKACYDQVAEGADLVLVGGIGAVFSTGISFGLPAWDVADALDARVLVVSRYKPDRTIDEILAAARLFGGRMVGAVINAVRPDQLERVKTTAVPFLEERGVPVFGVLPEEPVLFAIPVKDLKEGLSAQVLCGENQLDNLVERFAVGAMTTESALSHFRKIANKAVVTGSDRSDIILAALETSLRALILTGGYEPAARVLSAAFQRNVPVLLVREDTYTTIEQIDSMLEHVRFRQPEKMEHAQRLVCKHLNLDRLWEALGVQTLTTSTLCAG
jgi:BioD-like phosphotransacetylase family protein